MAKKRPYGKDPWYQIKSPEDAASQLGAMIDSLDNHQSMRQYNLLRHMSIYANRDYMSLSQHDAIDAMPRQILNTTQAIVDTLVAKHVLAESKVTFQVEDADFVTNQRAEDLDKFVWGEFHRLNLYQLAETAFRDALVTGDGWLKFFEVNGRVHAERVSALEPILDEAAASSSPSRELYQRRWVSRSAALALWPDEADALIQAGSADPPYMWPGTDTDSIRLIEGWHLPDINGEGGRHILSCDRVILVDEEWTSDTFPFVRMMWSPPQIGGYAQGLVEQLSPLQMKLNEMMKTIHDSLRLMAVPRVWQSAATKLTPEWNNRIGNIYKFMGPKPEIEVSQSNAPEVYAQAERLRTMMYELAGINMMEATGAMPSRMDSKPGLQEFQDIASTRHAWVGKMWERLFVDCAKQVIRVARDIVAKKGSYKAHGQSRSFVQSIDFKDCDLEDDRFVMKAMNVNIFPSTPAGKRASIKEFWEAGLFGDSKEEAWSMMSGHPDVDELLGRKTAPKKLVEKQLSTILKKNKYSPPDDFQDVEYAKLYAQELYQRLLLQDNVPRKKFELIIQYITECDGIIETKKQGVAQQMQEMMPPSGANINAGNSALPPASVIPPALGAAAAPAPL